MLMDNDSYLTETVVYLYTYGSDYHLIVTPTQSRLYIEGYLQQTSVKGDFPFLLKNARFSEIEKCYCFPCSSIIYRHPMFSTSYFKSSLSTISMKSVNAMPLSDFLQSHFEVVLKIMTIAELFIAMTALPG